VDRLTPEWQPKTIPTMQRIFREVGLDGSFWDVSPPP
jgi:hypothetical protein